MKKPNKKLTQREVLMGYVTLTVVLFGFARFIFLPQHAQVAESDLKIQTIHAKIDTDSKIIVMAASRAVASIPAKDTAYMSATRRLAQVIDHLITKDGRLVTRLIKVDKATQAVGYKDVALKVEVTGSFASIGSFVERLEASQILARVASVEIEREGVDLDKCVAKIAVNTRLFTEDDND